MQSRVELQALGLLPHLPTSFLHGKDLDLLRPLRFLGPGQYPNRSDRPANLDPKADRRDLAQALASTNLSYGHPKADHLAEKFANPETRVVVAGQQPGILGGPLYTLSKAVATRLWADEIEKSGEVAVPLFWVANDDHDFREIAQATFPTSDGPIKLDLGDDPAPLMPVGMRSLGSPIETLLHQLKERVPGERFESWVNELEQWYTPEARFGEAFCRLMVRLLGERCPLMVDSVHPAMKAAQRPWLTRLVDRRVEVEKVLLSQDKKINALGFELQVRPQRGASPLFMLKDNERRRIEWVAGSIGSTDSSNSDGPENSSYILRGGSGGVIAISNLLAAIEENPIVVSPGVLARPAIQDAVLGTAVQIMGPGEISYLPQVAPIYEILGIEAPWVTLRPQMMVLESHHQKKLEAAKISLAQLLSPDFEAQHHLAQGLDIDLMGPLRRTLDIRLAELMDNAVQIDQSLEGPWNKTSKQIAKSLDSFSARLRAAIARRDEVAARRLSDLRSATVPLGTMQERIISSAYFTGRHGERFVEALFEQLTLDPTTLHLIQP